MKKIINESYERSKITHAFDQLLPKEVKVIKGKALEKYPYYKKLISTHGFNLDNCKNDIVMYIKDETFNVKMLMFDNIYNAQFLLFHDDQIFINKKTKTMDILDLSDGAYIRIMYFKKEETNTGRADFFTEYVRDHKGAILRGER